ncbi:Gfo/Idh/MocA family oxidoreductase [uncultured Aquimarina sp.]|uniref:Gfo/Idh/MocA family protein n=1 Tax=uncultured Aquimarina sp. TaxID=575652 RepID=UPI00262E99DF|nr:Gfo/Idh/MocA family oxidoreductase [uncultured Aquimarina sp.]
MNSNKIYNWGILGCGKIAHKFAQDLQSIPNAKLQAVASRNIEKAKDFGDAYETPTHYGSYIELAKDAKIDIIYIATPHAFHYENTMMCLNEKKAVLCEKPFAMNKVQVLEMIQMAKSQNTFLMEALWTYFLPHYEFVLQTLKANQLGQIKSLKADFGFASAFDPNNRIFRKELGGGSLLDVGIYPLFAALSIIGIPEKIEASANFGETGIDEDCKIMLHYEDNVSADLFSSVVQKTETKAIIQLEHGTIIINSRFHEPSSVTITKDGDSKLYEFPVVTNGYNYEAIHVQNMLERGNIESTVMSFEKSLHLIELLDNVRKEIKLEY